MGCYGVYLRVEIFEKTNVRHDSNSNSSAKNQNNSGNNKHDNRSNNHDNDSRNTNHNSNVHDLPCIHMVLSEKVILSNSTSTQLPTVD